MLSKNRFSLIELILVISILLILISLASPALKKIFENANFVTCKHNLKQLSMAHHLYADDYNHHFVPTHGHLAGYKKPKNWNEILGIIGLYPSDDPATYCPSSDKPQSYGLNTTWLGAKTERIDRSIIRNLLESPSEKIHGGDCTDILTYSGRANPNQSLGWLIYGEDSFRSLAYRHDGQAITFYFDGSIKPLELGLFDNYIKHFYYNRIAITP